MRNNGKKSEKALKNIVANLVLQLTVAISGMILLCFFIIAYDSIMNGMIVSVMQFITYLALVEAGVSAASIVGLYKPIADHNIVEINRILSVTKRFYYTGIAYAPLLIVLVFYDYDSLTPGSVVKTTAELVRCIQETEVGFDSAQVRAFRDKFMASCDGMATERILQTVGLRLA